MQFEEWEKNIKVRTDRGKKKTCCGAVSLELVWCTALGLVRNVMPTLEDTVEVTQKNSSGFCG